MLSLAQLHFQKFFLPVRRGKRKLGSLSGYWEEGGQVGSRFPRALIGQTGALGPEAWISTGTGVRRTDQWNQSSHVRAWPGLGWGLRTVTGGKKA